MPQILTWRARAKDGVAVVRGDGHAPAEYREMDVQTSHPAVVTIRLSVDGRGGEAVRAFTRHHQRQAPDGQVVGHDAVPVLEVTTQGGDKVRLYLYDGEITLTTADLYR